MRGGWHTSPHSMVTPVPRTCQTDFWVSRLSPAVDLT
jgi:hypothetical protein